MGDKAKPLNGQKWVIMGNTGVQHETLKYILGCLGATVQRNCTAGAIVLAGKKPGSELKRARKLGLVVYTMGSIEQSTLSLFDPRGSQIQFDF